MFRKKASSTTFNVFNDDIYNNGQKKLFKIVKKNRIEIKQKQATERESSNIK